MSKGNGIEDAREEGGPRGVRARHDTQALFNSKLAGKSGIHVTVHINLVTAFVLRQRRQDRRLCESHILS